MTNRPMKLYKNYNESKNLIKLIIYIGGGLLFTMSFLFIVLYQYLGTDRYDIIAYASMILYIPADLIFVSVSVCTFGYFGWLRLKMRHANPFRDTLVSLALVVSFFVCIIIPLIFLWLLLEWSSKRGTGLNSIHLLELFRL